MNKEKIGIPKLRFPGFTGAWEQRKVSDIFTVTRGQVLATTKISEVKTNEMCFPVYSSQTKNNGLMGYYNKYLFNTAITWTTDGANAGTVNYREGKFYSTNVNGVLLSDDGYANRAIAEILDRVAWRHVSRVGNPKLMNNVMSNIKISIPSSFEEQNAISEFLTKFDHLIALHQRKLEHLKQQKNGLLQKMFPKSGESVPEVRFPGFTDSWEQRRLGEVADSVEYGINAPAKEYDGINKYLRITDIDDTTHEFLQSDLTSPDTDLTLAEKFKLLEGDILFARTGASVGKSYIYSREDGSVYYAGFLIRMRFNKSISPNFIFQNTLTTAYKQYVEVTSQRSGQPGVNAKEYSNYSLYIPSKEEQQKIGSFFQQLDTLIALYQRKLEHLELLKKGLLQQMFV